MYRRQTTKALLVKKCPCISGGKAVAEKSQEDTTWWRDKVGDINKCKDKVVLSTLITRVGKLRLDEDLVRKKAPASISSLEIDDSGFAFPEMPGNGVHSFPESDMNLSSVHGLFRTAFNGFTKDEM